MNNKKNAEVSNNKTPKNAASLSKKKHTLTIILKAYDCSILDNAVEKVINLAKQERLLFQGPIPLPNKKTLFTILTSPHIDKHAMNQFWQIESKRIIFIVVNDSFINSLSKIELPSGVHVKIKMQDNKVKENV